MAKKPGHTKKMPPKKFGQKVKMHRFKSVDKQSRELVFKTGGTEIRMEPDGTFELNGKKLGQDQEIYRAFRKLAGQVCDECGRADRG